MKKAAERNFGRFFSAPQHGGAMKEQYNTYEIVHKFLYIFLGITTKTYNMLNG